MSGALAPDPSLLPSGSPDGDQPDAGPPDGSRSDAGRPDRSGSGPTVRPRRIRRRPVATAVAFAVAFSVLVCGTVFAFVAANTNDGATNAQAAVRDFLDAVTHGDAVGALGQLPPPERDALAAHLPGIAQQLQRLGLLAPLSLSSIPGVKVELRDVGYHVTELYGEVARVTLASGSIVVTTDAASFPLDVRARDLLERDFGATVDPTGAARVISLDDHPLTLVAIKDSGGWHTSLYFSVAEAIRGAQGGSGPIPPFNVGVTPVGADTPEAAVRGLFDAATGLDAVRAAELAYPGEARALLDYTPLFVPESQRRAVTWRDDDGFDAEIADLSLQVGGSGGTRQVTVSGFDGTITDRARQAHLTYDGRCLTTATGLAGGPPTSTTTGCDGEVRPPSPDEQRRSAGDRLAVLTAWQRLGRAFPTFVVVEKNGRWFVSPTRTVLGTLEEVLRGLDPAEADAAAATAGWLWSLYGLPGAATPS